MFATVLRFFKYLKDMTVTIATTCNLPLWKVDSVVNNSILWSSGSADADIGSRLAHF